MGHEGGAGLTGNAVCGSEPPARPAIISPRRGDGGRFEPLSAERFRVQFTASLALKEKLELARDLMRHANPSGDFAPIVERALDLLLAQLMHRRFGKTRRVPRDSASTTLRQESSTTSSGREGLSTESVAPSATGDSRPDVPSQPAEPPASQGEVQGPQEQRTPVAAGRCATMRERHVPAGADLGAWRGQEASIPAAACATDETSAPPGCDGGALSSRPPDEPAPVPTGCDPSPRTARVTNATRRAVAARDGLQCSWVDAQGRRCASRAWLEYDHRQPRGKGGSSDAHNVRIFCRAHNQFAAEQAYGRQRMGRFARRAAEP